MSMFERLMAVVNFDEGSACDGRWSYNWFPHGGCMVGREAQRLRDEGGRRYSCACRVALWFLPGAPLMMGDGRCRESRGEGLSVMGRVWLAGGGGMKFPRTK
jgi:hypothetical protein